MYLSFDLFYLLYYMQQLIYVYKHGRCSVRYTLSTELKQIYYLWRFENAIQKLLNSCIFYIKCARYFRTRSYFPVIRSIVSSDVYFELRKNSNDEYIICEAGAICLQNQKHSGPCVKYLSIKTLGSFNLSSETMKRTWKIIIEDV